MKSLIEYINEKWEFDWREADYDPHETNEKPIGPGLQKFLDKYEFKPILDSEIHDAIKYTHFYPAKRTGETIFARWWYKPLKDGSYLIARLDGSGMRPTKYTGTSGFDIWKKGTATEWLLVKRIGDHSTLWNPKESEEMLLNSKVDKLF